MFTDRKMFLQEQCSQTQEESALFEQGVLALHFARPEEAMRYFSLIKRENGAVLFNKALCFFTAGDYSESLRYLQEALSKMAGRTLMQSTENRRDCFKKFGEESDGYCKPMLYSTPEYFPDLAKEQILLLSVEVLFFLDQKEEMLRVIACLHNKNYRSIREKLERNTENDLRRD